MKIIVSDIEYEISEYEIQDDRDGVHVSEIDLMNNIIGIQPGLPINQKHLAILHEAMHAINWKISEDSVEFLSHALYSFIKRNPEFISEILDLTSRRS